MIPIAKPTLDEREAAAARRVILSGWVVQGPEVAAFEREFAAAVGAAEAVAVSSGTAALHLALLAAGVGPGDEVITVSHSFIATANAVRHAGASPVFVDIEPATYNIDPALIERAITPRTRAVLPVHQLGLPCDLRAVLEIAARRGLAVVEDAACAIGSELEWRGAWERIGRPHGLLACFSFHPRKILTTGDGGMITTASPELAARLRVLRQHGLAPAGGFAELGYNYRMTDIQAAIGRSQLERLPALVARRRELAAGYAQRLARIPGLGCPIEPGQAHGNWQSYCVRLPEGRDQRAVMQRLEAAGVSSRTGVMCAHREPAYAGWPREGLTESERAQDRGLMLPLYDGMTDEELDHVARALEEACG